MNLSVLGKNLKRVKCKKALSLERITSERRLGLHSTLSIECDSCQIKTHVDTGKIHLTASSGTYADVNLSLVFGKFYIYNISNKIF